MPDRLSAHRLLSALMLLVFALLPLQGVRPHPRITVSDVVLVAAAVVALAVRGSRPLRSWLTRPLAAGLALMVAGGAFGLITAHQAGHSLGLLLRLTGVMVLGLWVVWRWDPTAEGARRALRAYVVVAAISAAAGAAAAFTEVDLLSLQNGVGRAQGFSGNANLFGAITAVALAVTAVLYATAPRGRPRWGWALAGALLAAGIAWSGSRSAALGAAAGLVPLAVHVARGRSPKGVIAAGAAVVLVLVLGLAGVVRVPVVDRFLLRTDTDASARSSESTDVRVGQLTRGLEERGELSLLIGSGLRDDNPTALHNAHLEVWLGLGLVGMAGWVTVIVLTSAPAARLVRRQGPGITAASAPLLAASSGFIAYAVCAAFVDNVWNRYIWLLVALVAVLGHPASGDAVAPPTSSPRTAP